MRHFGQTMAAIDVQPSPSPTVRRMCRNVTRVYIVHFGTDWTPNSWRSERVQDEILYELKEAHSHIAVAAIDQIPRVALRAISSVCRVG